MVKRLLIRKRKYEIERKDIKKTKESYTSALLKLARDRIPNTSQTEEGNLQTTAKLYKNEKIKTKTRHHSALQVPKRPNSKYFTNRGRKFTNNDKVMGFMALCCIPP